MGVFRTMARVAALGWALIPGLCVVSCQAFSGVGDLKIVEDSNDDDRDDESSGDDVDADDLAGGGRDDDQRDDSAVEAGPPDDEARDDVSADDETDEPPADDTGADDDSIDDDPIDDPADDDSADDGPDAGPLEECEPSGGAACDLEANCGCAGEQTCYFDPESAEVACRAVGDAAIGEACSDSDDCDSQATCLAGRCQRPCFDGSSCAGAEACSAGFLSDQLDALEQQFCVRTCEPFELDTGCAAGERCHLLSDELTGCFAPGAAELTDPCERGNDCGEGLECADLAGTGDATCQPRCAVEQGCNGTCQPLDPEQTYDGDTLGACSCEYPEGWGCSPKQQCGCAPGQACSIVLPDYETECHAPGIAETREVCRENVDCVAGQLCLLGVCSPYCEVNEDCPDEGRCVVDDDFEPPFGLCTTPCDPIAPQVPEDGSAACPEQMTCLPFFEGQSAEFTCATEQGSAAQGESCESEFDLFQCAPGFACAPAAAGDALQCRKWCEVGQACEGGGVCQATTSFRGRELGLCTTPVCGNGLVEGAEVCDDGNLDEGDGCTTACVPCGILNEQSECNLAPSCGCGANEACQITDGATGAAMCVPEGTNQLDERCDDVDDCASGLSCVGIGPSLQRCTSQCSASNDAACSATEACSQLYSGTELSPNNFVCLDVCDPVQVGFEDQDVQACAAGTQCVPGVSYASCIEDTGNGAPLDDCTRNSECRSGAVCVVGVCRTACRSQVDCSQSGDACNQGLGLFANPDEPVGVCAEPCEPVGPDSGCGEGRYCLASSEPPICVQAMAVGAVGDACDYHAECSEGLACAAGCVQWCRTIADCSGAAPSCLQVSGYVDADGVELGICN